MNDWYQDLPVRFGIRSENVEVICEPSEMYAMMISLIKSSKRRIGLASLYIGNGQLETELIAHLHEALSSRPDLTAHILLDHSRGSRGTKSSRAMLLPCLRDHPKQLILSLFHTPSLAGMMKSVLPERFNELLGLQHMKAYIFDDTIMLSGANMSTDYFTNRQDRCIVIRDSPALCQFFYSLIDVVSRFSYQVNGHNEAKLHDHCLGCPSAGSECQTFIQHAASEVAEFLAANSTDVDCSADADTWVYPVLQMGPFDIRQEHRAMKDLLVTAGPSEKIYLATAYFNPLDEYLQLITSRSKAEYHLLTASPQANGFTPAAGLAGYIPMAYRWYEASFVSHVFKSSQAHRIKLYEYAKDGWTFHSKGLWYYDKDSRLPTMTIIGSSNYGYRSVQLDLEAQVVLSTESPRLQSQLHLERENLYSKSALVDRVMVDDFSRKMPVWTRFVSRLFRYMF